MNCYGIDVQIRNVPPLDPDFIPILQFNRTFLQTAKMPVGIAVERPDGQTAVYHTYIHGTPEMADADCYYMDRLVKTLLWMKGGCRVYVSGSQAIFHYLQSAYAPGGSRDFDQAFMAQVFEQPFAVVWCDTLPEEQTSAQAIGGHLDGCRIGFDAGGSDRKVSAVINGDTVYSEEVVWHPKTHADPQYHYDGIVSALKTAAAHLPRVDAVGISSAGVFIENRTMSASLFLKVPPELQREKVRDIFTRAVADTFGNVPCAVINDGDVSALAGAMSLGRNNVLGIAMGTSEAVGFVDGHGCITGWLNELAFVPVDTNPAAAMDPWSGDIGCGVQYFSQDAVIKLAPRAGITLSDQLSPAEKLKEVQKLMEQGNPAAEAIFTSIGVYLGHTLACYYELYGCQNVLLLGRVMSGRGGDRIFETCRQVLEQEYPKLTGKLVPSLPDEAFRRVGQSMAAASLPALR